MPQNPVLAGDVLTAGLRNTFIDAYRNAGEKMAASALPKVMDLGLPSDKLTEPYAYFESAPFPVRWQRGEAITSKAFKDVGWTTTNYAWAIRVEWHENDRVDDQTGSLYSQAASAGENWATLPERVFFQIITGATDSDLLPAIPTAPDGSAVYAATRFGISAGNIITGSGVTTTEMILTDFFGALEAFLLMQDTEGQPLWTKDLVQDEFVIAYNVENERIFREAFLQSIQFKSIASETSPYGPAAAAVSNIIQQSGVRFDLWPTQRLTDNDWFVFATASKHKAVYRQNRQPLREIFTTMENSDEARRTKTESGQWDSREGYGAFIPYQTMKINN